LKEANAAALLRLLFAKLLVAVCTKRLEEVSERHRLLAPDESLKHHKQALGTAFRHELTR